MAKKRAKVSDQVDELPTGDRGLFDRTGLEPEPAQRPPHPKKLTKAQLAGRVTYTLGAELKEVIRAESVRLGVPASQLARYLLTIAWNDYAGGQIDPPPLLPSDSPAYRNVIDFGE